MANKVIPDPAAGLDLTLRQGSDQEFDVVWWADEAKTIQVVPDSARAQYRKTRKSPDVLLEITSYITIAVDGTIQVRIPASATDDLTAPAKGYWDLEAVAGTEVRALVAGAVVVLEEVTRP